MLQNPSPLQVYLARTEADIRAAQRLRYKVFVKELGGDSDGVDHQLKLERDEFDSIAEHLIIKDPNIADKDTDGVVGVYRLMTSDHAREAGRFYSGSEFDLSKLETTNRRLLELGRSCLHPDYRGGLPLAMLWHHLRSYVQDHDIEIIFGSASFHGTDSLMHQQSVSLLHELYLSPSEIRVQTRTPHSMKLLSSDQIDRKSAMRDVPSLIKSYLKIGGRIGEGVFVDKTFNTTDICLVLETKNLDIKSLNRPIWVAS